MPTCAVRYELELLCQWPRPRFEARVPFGDILSFLVRRLFVAQFVALSMLRSRTERKRAGLRDLRWQAYRWALGAW